MKFLGMLLGILTLALWYRPRTVAGAILFWAPKLISGALAPLQAVLGAVLALYGLVKRDWALTGMGAAESALHTAHVQQVSRDRTSAFDTLFGQGWRARIPKPLADQFLPRPWQPLFLPSHDIIWQRDLIVGKKYAGGPLLADLWQPKPGRWRSGLAILYTHGGAWRYGNKDMLTRPQFRHLAHQGHVILDIDYSITEETPIEAMVRETKQALLWLKQHAGNYGIDPNRIVLMGGSAGAHLALLTAYTPGHRAFRPRNMSGDERVLGVIAYYPPVDFHELYRHNVRQVQFDNENPWAQPLAWLMFLLLKALGFAEDMSHLSADNNFLTRLLGGTPDRIPERYRLLSPINHVSPTSPPTLILIGKDDFFRFHPGAVALHRQLRRVGAGSALIDFPHTDHAFDLVLPQFSPAAQAAIFHIERFLAGLLGQGGSANAILSDGSVYA